jgi:hypothetical protein
MDLGNQKRNCRDPTSWTKIDIRLWLSDVLSSSRRTIVTFAAGSLTFEDVPSHVLELDADFGLPLVQTLAGTQNERHACTKVPRQPLSAPSGPA